MQRCRKCPTQGTSLMISGHVTASWRVVAANETRSGHRDPPRHPSNELRGTCNMHGTHQNKVAPSWQGASVHSTCSTKEGPGTPCTITDKRHTSFLGG